MKQVTSIVCIIILFTSFTKDWWVWLSFYGNRDYITKAYCINRNKPSLHCDGKCFLMQKLQQRRNSEENSSKSAKVSEPKQVEYLPQNVFFIHIYTKENDHPHLRLNEKFTFYKWAATLFKPPC